MEIPFFNKHCREKSFYLLYEQDCKLWEAVEANEDVKANLKKLCEKLK